MSLSPMSHVESKKCPCRPVDFRGQWPYMQVVDRHDSVRRQPLYWRRLQGWVTRHTRDEGFTVLGAMGKLIRFTMVSTRAPTAAK